MAVMQVNIARLSEGRHSHQFEVTPADLGLGEPYSGRIFVDVDLDRSGRQILLHSRFRASGSFICDRCLESFTGPMEGDYRILYVPDGTSMPVEAVEGEVQTVPADAQVISLDEDARQYIQLAVPSKLLCRDDCSGLCPRCGKNWNTGPCSCDQQDTDSRWDALKKLTKS
ncbi:MAG: DUF177 domain-containing protein [Bacteroidetes bacterium]|jgi:uncharacterized protein|nr:DUF177 domain-containing protein [Bacteroidota bacterium]